MRHMCDFNRVSADVGEVHFEPFSWFLCDVCITSLMTNLVQVQISDGVFPQVFAAIGRREWT